MTITIYLTPGCMLIKTSLFQKCLNSLATIATETDIKVPGEMKTFSEEYLSVSLQHIYSDDKFEYSGEILIGFFSSPIDGYNLDFFNHNNIFYNLTASFHF